MSDEPRGAEAGENRPCVASRFWDYGAGWRGAARSYAGPRGRYRWYGAWRWHPAVCLPETVPPWHRVGGLRAHAGGFTAKQTPSAAAWPTSWPPQATSARDVWTAVASWAAATWGLQAGPRRSLRLASTIYRHVRCLAHLSKNGAALWTNDRDAHGTYRALQGEQLLASRKRESGRSWESLGMERAAAWLNNKGVSTGSTPPPWKNNLGRRVDWRQGRAT